MNFLHDYYRWRAKHARNEQDKIDFRLKAYRHSRAGKAPTGGGLDLTFEDFSKEDIRRGVEIANAKWKMKNPGAVEWHKKAIRIDPELKPKYYRLVPKNGIKLKNGEEDYELVEIKIELDYSKDNLHFMPANRAKPKTKK